VVAEWVAFPYIKSHPCVLNKPLFQVLVLRTSVSIILPQSCITFVMPNLLIGKGTIWIFRRWIAILGGNEGNYFCWSILFICNLIVTECSLSFVILRMAKKLFVELRVGLCCCIRGDILRTAGKYGFIIVLAEEIKSAHWFTSSTLIYVCLLLLFPIEIFYSNDIAENIPFLKREPGKDTLFSLLLCLPIQLTRQLMILQLLWCCYLHWLISTSVGDLWIWGSHSLTVKNKALVCVTPTMLLVVNNHLTFIFTNKAWE
jgi:hypothetical protein